MDKVRAYAAGAPAGRLEPFEYDPGKLGREQVEIKVQFCGICHSDLSMWQNHWQMTQFPFVPGHEVVGEVVAMGDNVRQLKIGQTVGLGWFSESCMHCHECRSGDHNLCADAEQTMIGRYGGFADRVRCHWNWAVPMPPGIDQTAAGPLFCGGITVFNPIIQCRVQPTDRVGVVGIGGLGHLALQFLAKWGCEVTAFTSSAAKGEEAKKFGAHNVVASRDDAALEKMAGHLDFLLVTANAPMNWDAYLSMLNPRGRLHFVGAVPEPIQIPVMSLILGGKSISGSPLGSPATCQTMLEFCVRHDIAPQIETYPLSKVNEAMEHLKSGNARYRIVLKNDF